MTAYVFRKNLNRLYVKLFVSRQMCGVHGCLIIILQTQSVVRRVLFCFQQIVQCIFNTVRIGLNICVLNVTF